MPMKITEAEKIVADELGPDFAVVNLSGVWMVYPKVGNDIDPSRRGESRKLDLAIARCKANL